MLVTIVAFAGVLIVIILAHELGHFVTAKVTGVRVEEFGLGFPPRLLSIKRGETRYSLNALPLGGFVKLAGEEDPNVPGSLASKGIATRILVLGAGSLMNLLLPLLLLSIAFMVPHDVAIGQVTVSEVAPNSPAAQAGIAPGDTLVSINGKPVHNTGYLQRYLYLNLGKEVTALIKRSDSTTKEVQLTSRWEPPEGQGAIGVLVSTSSPTVVSQHYPFWKAIPLGATSALETFLLFKNGIISIIIGAEPVILTGPVGIAQLTGEVVKAGFSPLLEFAALISINLGLINLFPLPALDGGRIALVLLEWVRRGKRIAPKTEWLVHTIGLALLIAAILAITYQDIMRIISGESLLP